MIKFFRIIRKRLLKEGNFKKYSAYAIGEIFLVVIGILIAVNIGEWRQNIKKENERIGYYNNIKDDLIQDKLRLSILDSLFRSAEKGILKEIDKMQLNSYNEDSLYSNVPAWMVYVAEFAPNNSTFTEIVSSGKLQLFKNKELKSEILNLYGNVYPELILRQTLNNEFIRDLRTIELMDTYRFMKILDNDNIALTNVNLNNPKVKIDHKWLDDKQSEKYLRFENYLNLTRGAYVEIVRRYAGIITTLDDVIIEIDKELIKE